MMRWAFDWLLFAVALTLSVGLVVAVRTFDLLTFRSAPEA